LVNSSQENDFYWVEHINKPSLFRIKAKDEMGIESDPVFFFLSKDKIVPKPGEDEIKLNLDYFFEDGFLNFVLEFNSILSKTPDLSLRAGSFEFRPLVIKQTSLRKYKTVYPFSETKARDLRFKVSCQSVLGDSANFVNEIPLSIATPLDGGEVVSRDGMAKIRIDSGTVYKDIQLKIEQRSPSKRSIEKGKIYSFEPKDVPFAKSARISLSYKGENCNPEKLALYEYKNGSWRFVGNKLDFEEKTVWKIRWLLV
jgi:hypothetical protein